MALMSTSSTEGILGGHENDCFIGNQYVNRSCLAPRAKQSTSRTMALRSDPNNDGPDHPLYQVINFTSHPIRGAWKRLGDTIKDICGILADKRAAKILDDLEGMDGKSDSALMRVNEFFLDLTTAVSEDIEELERSSSTQKGRKHGPSTRPTNSNDIDADPSGIRGIYSHIALAVSALIHLHIDQRNNKTHLHLSKDAYEKMNRTSTKAMRSLAYLLVLGPVAMFSCPTDRKFVPQWQASMLTEWGALVVDSRARNSPPQTPPWSNFGNTRVHIIQTLAKMGFGSTAEIDWTHVMNVFVKDLSQKRLAGVLWEDIALITDFDVQKDAEVVWAHSVLNPSPSSPSLS